jgi:hypothetical protein
MEGKNNSRPPQAFPGLTVEKIFKIGASAASKIGVDERTGFNVVVSQEKPLFMILVTSQ